MNQDIYEELQEREQSILNDAGLADVKFIIGHFRVDGDHFRVEARLTGPRVLQKKAHQLLSFI